MASGEREERGLTGRLVRYWRRFRAISARHGAGAALKTALHGLLNRAIGFRSVIGYALTPATAQPEFTRCPDGMEFRAGTPEDLRRCVADGELDIDEAFAADAVARQDPWYLILDGEVPVCFVWFAERPTEAYPGIEIVLGPTWLYGYKAFCRKSHRGRRLGPICTIMGMLDLGRSGREGLVVLVETINYPSLKTCAAQGFAPFALAHIARYRGRLRVRYRRGAGVHGFALRETATG